MMASPKLSDALRALEREQPGQHRMDQQQEALVRPVLQEQEWRVEQERLQRDQPPQGQQALARRVQLEQVPQVRHL